MFVPNNTCTYYAQTGQKDVFSNYSFNPPVSVPCSVVTLDLKVVKTSIRVDASASRGRVDEDAGTARLLFPAGTAITIGDIITVDGDTLEISSVFPRRTTLGVLDHIQVDCKAGQVPS